jgi:two-component system, chemotaxis family, chemotaxis protein CheY
VASSTKVLVIDDDPVITAIYNKHFRAAHYNVKVAHGAILGLQTLQTFLPDVVLLDLKMPFRSGVEWLQTVRKIDAFKTLPVIIVTGEPPGSPLVRSALGSVVTGVLFKAEWDPGAVVAAVAWAARKRQPASQAA